MATAAARCRDLGNTPLGVCKMRKEVCARQARLWFSGRRLHSGETLSQLFRKFIESPGKASECFFLWELGRDLFSRSYGEVNA